MPTRSPAPFLAMLATLVAAVVLSTAAWACGPVDDAAGPNATVLMLVASVVLTAAAGYATLVSGVLNAVEQHRGQDLTKPRLWFLRLVTVGVGGFWLALELASRLSMMPGIETAPALLWTIVFSTPLVLQAAYGAWTWHRGQTPAA